MKKSLLALAALTAFAGVASAQSSVTMFGILDLAAREVKNGAAGSRSSLSTDATATNRFGVRGVEDLGGGMSASFHIEGSVGTDTGTAGATNNSGASAFWNRVSTIGLRGGFGEVRLGRDYTPTFLNHVVFDPFSAAGVAAQINMMNGSGNALLGQRGVATLVRADNSIGYYFRSGGVYGQAMVSAGEGNNANKYMGFRVGYAAGPVNVAFALGKTDDLVRATPGPAQEVDSMNLGASYNLGFMTLMGQYHQYKRSGASQKNISIGTRIPVGKGIVKAQYQKVSDFRKADQIGLGYEYGLSKRTALFANYGRVSNDGLAAFTASGSGPTPIGTGFTSTGYDVGIRHSF
jgi:predicted porin